MTKQEYIKDLQKMIKDNEKAALASDDHKFVIRTAAVNTALQKAIELAKKIKKT